MKHEEKTDALRHELDLIKTPKLPAWKFAADCYNLEISKLITLKGEK